MAAPFLAADQGGDAARVLIKRGPLVLVFDPLEFWYEGVQVGLSPLEGAILSLLMRRGRATWEMIDEVLRGGESSAAVRDILVHRIRRKFKKIGADDPIQTIRGWGLRLRVHADATRSSGLLIGARTHAF